MKDWAQGWGCRWAGDYDIIREVFTKEEKNQWYIQQRFSTSVL